jgi:organic radical activating enzyme
MFGNNKIMQPIAGDGFGAGESLDVVKIFATLQGEGQRAGQPAIFIRLGGCNLACKFCDTEFDVFENKTLDEILAEVIRLRVAEKLIVITGGEPLRQPIEKLCELLIAQGFVVQIETNGTLFRPLHNDVEIVCSPKVKTQIRGDLLERITAFKFLISKTMEGYQAVPNVGQALSNAPIYIQAIDEYDTQKNADNLEYAKSLTIKNGYNLSIQLHKILGIE